MMDVKLTVDVMCDWMAYPPSYRVYVDGDLLTERSYIWDNEHEFVREHLAVTLSPGTHTLVIEPVIKPENLAVFKTKNFCINGAGATLGPNNTFTI